MNHKAYGYFGLLGIGNVVNQVLTNPLVVSSIKKLSKNAKEIKKYMTGCTQI